MHHSQAMDGSMEAEMTTPVPRISHFRVLSLNMQVGLHSQAYHHYVTQAWKHVLPSRSVRPTLDRIAKLAADYEVVALQEADAGSFRSGQINQVEYLAERAGFPHWHAAVNRNLKPLAQHCLGVLSRWPLRVIRHHPLPGRVSGRGALEVEISPDRCAPFRLVIAHLALGRGSRHLQLAYLGHLVGTHPRSMVVGDFNCEPEEIHAHPTLYAGGLKRLHTVHSFPSWAPSRSIDHVLATDGLQVSRAYVLDHCVSDHLPVVAEVACAAVAESTCE